MKAIQVIRISVGLFILCFLPAASGFSISPEDWTPELRRADAEIEEEFEWLQEESNVTFVITASRVLEDIRKSAASITVVTYEQIREMGAQHLMDVFRMVPGVSAWYHADGHYRIDIRGVSKVGGQDVLMMLNSHPLNNNFSGGATWSLDTLPVDNIERVEIIRGPGSALYGANAFSGVINVITKKAVDFDGYQLTAGAGSYDKQQYNFLMGQYFGEVGVTFNLNYLNTHGPERYIERDAQSITDQLLGTDASLAPDYAETGDEKIDAALNVTFREFTLDARYVDRERKPAVNALWSMNENNVSEPEDYYVKLSYERDIWEGLNLYGKIYTNYHSDRNYHQGLTNGAVVPTPMGFVPLPPDEGLIAELSNENRRYGFEVQSTYRINDAHTTVAGVTYEDIEQEDVTYHANFLYTPVPGVVIPLDSVQDLSDVQNFNIEADREFLAFFIQHLWDITDDVRLTVGARYDDYSDFGSSFNPRVGLTWQFLEEYDLKLLYGRAFRAPTFQELYTQNNPALLGNPDLDPETVDTYEISLGAMLENGFSGRITGFWNTIEDNIDLIQIDETTGNAIFGNKDDLESIGMELELRFNFDSNTYVGMNYTYQDSENQDTG
ncbi:MAG: TonB-dependent receptor plug domain-containing protein, partial [Thermodesulfobacteriota bacterium]